MINLSELLFRIKCEYVELWDDSSHSFAFFTPEEIESDSSIYHYGFAREWSVYNDGLGCLILRVGVWFINSGEAQEVIDHE